MPEQPDAVQAVPPNTLVNNPAADTTEQDTQSTTALVLGAGTTVLSAFNDSGSFIGGSNHFTGIARSTNSGGAWTDQGTLPTSANGDGGYPVLARSVSTGTVVLSTLGFNSPAVLQVFRSTDNGATYGAPIDATALGGGSNDKEWVTCDNFPGAGQGNFYLFWRDFAAGRGMVLTRSTNDGVTWGDRRTVFSPTQLEQAQGAWVVVGADHAVYCFWLQQLGGVTTMKMRKSTDQGSTFGASVIVATLRTTGLNGDLGLNGGFRTNAFVQVVAHPLMANQLYAIWNDKGISPSIDKANIYFSQTADGGTTWSAPIQVNNDAGTNDNWQPVIAITPDGVSLFTSWYDRRRDPLNSLIEVFARHAVISGTTATFGPEYPVTEAAFPVVIGQDPVISTSDMGVYDTAVADDNLFYRTWGDNRLAQGTHAHQPDVRFTKIPRFGPGAIIEAAGSILETESCTPANNAPDPGETVTIEFLLRNIGTGNTTSLVATLEATGGVTSPSGPQNYGAVVAGGPPVSRPFTFQASGACGGTVNATFQLQNGTTNLGNVAFAIPIGTIPTQTFQNTAAITINDGNAATPYPSNINVSGVSTYSRVTLTVVGLTHNRPDDIDIVVVAPGGQRAYVISDVGGSVLANNLIITLDDAAATTIEDDGPMISYTFKPSNVDTSDTFPAPAPAGPYAETFADFASLGANANGAWSLFVRDDANQGFGDGAISGGWSLHFLGSPSCASCAPVPLSAVSRKTHGATAFDIALPLVGTAGVECRTTGATNDYQLVVTFPATVTVTGSPQAQVTLGSGQVGTGGTPNGGAVSVSGAIITVPLTNIANAQTINVTLFGVSDGSNTGNILIPMGVLVGDTTANGSVTSSDIGQTKAASGQPVNASNFRTDVTVSGSINTSDIGLVKSRAGTALPP